VNLFNELGLDTGIDIKNLAAISRSLVPVIGEKYFSGKLYKIN
jgi:glucuronate isomerase